MRLLICGVLLCFAFSSHAQLTEDTVESLDKVIDVVLDLVRIDNGLKRIFNSVKVGLNLTEEGVHLYNLTLTDVLQLYRGGESYIELEEDKLVTNTTFEVKNLTIDLDWSAKKWFVSLDGTARLNLEFISVNTVIGVEGLKVTLIDADVPQIGHLEVTDFTGTSSVFNGMVRSLVEEIVNMNSTKKMISDQIDDTIRDIFKKIFK